MGVVLNIGEGKREGASIKRLLELTAADMGRVNELILARAGSEVQMIPEVANHLISSGGKRLRPMVTLAAAQMFGYSGDGHVKLATSVEFMHTATLLHDDVVDESGMRRGKKTARMIWGNQASVLVGDEASDAGVAQQRFDEGDDDGVVGADEFDHARKFAGRCCDVNRARRRFSPGPRQFATCRTHHRRPKSDPVPRRECWPWVSFSISKTGSADQRRSRN